MKLDHERLEVYGLARELRRGLVGLTAGLPKGHAEVRDQASRAALSIKLNIAEGTGEYAPKEKVRFYRMARRSAAECSALIDDLEDLDLITDSQSASAHRLIVRIVSALVRLIQSIESKSPKPSPTPDLTHARAHAPARPPTPTPKPTPQPSPTPTPTPTPESGPTL